MGGYDRMFINYMAYLYLNNQMERFTGIVRSRNLNLNLFIKIKKY